MLILVGVTISIVIDSGLIGKAREAGEITRSAYDSEAHYGEQAQITIGGVTYNSIAEYEAVLNGGSNPGANDTLTIAVEEIATESRAEIVRVSLDVPVPDLEELEASGEEGRETVQDMFAEAIFKYWDWNCSWEDILDDINDENVDTVTEVFETYVDWGDIDEDEFDDAYAFIIAQKVYLPKATFTCNGQVETNVREADFVFTQNGIEYEVIAEVNGETGRTGTRTTSQCKVETFSDICTEPTELKTGANGIVTPVTDPGDTIVAVIPAGFAYGTSENVGKVSTGLVITDSVDANHYSTGNEFVWIPVDSDLNVGTGTKKMAQLQSGSTTNYEGVLYDFSGTGNETTSVANSNYTASGTSLGEPRILTHADAIDSTKETNQYLDLQTKYNTMIAKVKLAGGFYVGRYELGAGNNNNISKLGVTPATAWDGHDSNGDGGQAWYGLYEKAGSYSHPNSTYAGTVTSQMIWGSQYDAMLNFALEGSDKSKVNLESLGNHTDVMVKTGTAIPTNVGTDKIINIYDLAGNGLEWTAEAYVASFRVHRGGDFYSTCTDPADFRGGYSPLSTDDYFSARATLYVNGYGT